MNFFSLIEVILVALFGTIAVPTPFGITPLPENPALLRAAPEDSVFYLEWFGTAEPNPASRNRTERLAAEPQVRNFVAAIAAATRKLMVEEEGPASGMIFDTAVSLLSRPGCVFAFDVDFDQPSASVGIVVDLGDQAASVQKSMEQFSKMLNADADGGMAQSATFKPAHTTITFRALSLDADAWWTILDGTLAIAVGTDAAAKIAEGLTPAEGRRGLDESARYRSAQSRAAVARPTSRSYVDLHALYEAGKNSGAGGFIRAAAQLGLDDVQALVSESGLEGDGFVQRIAFSAEDDLRLLEVFEGETLTAQDFAIVPADATLAIGMSGSPVDVLESGIELANSIVLGAGTQARREMFSEINRELGIDLEKDLLAHIGDKLFLWSAPSQGGNLLMNGLTLAVELDDAESFKPGFTKVMSKISSEFAKQRDRRRRRWSRYVELESWQHDDGTTLWMFNPVRQESIVAPTFAVTDGHLLISLFPQTIKSQLDRKPDAASLAQDQGLARNLGAKDTRVAGFFDMGEAWGTLYPALQIAAELAAGELQGEGLDIDMRHFPTYGSIAGHVGREYIHGTLNASSVTMSRSGVLPYFDPLFGIGGAMMIAPAFYFGFSSVELMPPVPAAPKVAPVPVPKKH